MGFGYLRPSSNKALVKIPDAGEFDYNYFKICGYSDEANGVLAAARGGGGGGGT